MHTHKPHIALTDHLGNTRAIFGDYMLGSISAAAPFVVTDLHAHQTAMYNYYAFGSPKPNTYSASTNSITAQDQYYDDPAPPISMVGVDYKYRYGFNGQEKDNEIKGTGNSLDFGARVYDSRLGRFLSVDPWSYKYVWQSSYAYYKNSPISTIDYKGKGDGKYFNTKGQEIADDGIADEKKYITTNNSEIKKATENKGAVKADDMKKSVLLPKKNEFKIVLERSLEINTTKTDDFKGDDDMGGHHEESVQGSWDVPIANKPGDFSNTDEDAMTKLCVPANTALLCVNDKSLIYAIHTHPEDKSEHPTFRTDYNAIGTLKNRNAMASNGYGVVISASNNMCTFFNENNDLFRINMSTINRIYEKK